MSRLYKYLNEAYTAEDRANLFAGFRANIIATLLRDCKQYLNVIDVDSEEDFVPSMDLFYRADNTIIMKGGISVKKVPVRSGRIPQGTNSKLFPIINKWLASNQFVPRDNCVIASSSEEHAETFGKVRLIFPIGPFKYTWINALDFNFNNTPNDHSIDGWDGFGLVWLLKDEIIKSVPKAIGIYNYHGDVLEKGDDYYNQDVLKIMKECSPAERKELRIWSMSMNGEGDDDDTIVNWDKRAVKVKDVFHKSGIQAAATFNAEIWFDCKEYYLVDPLILFFH